MYLDNHIHDATGKHPVRRSDEWSGVVMAQAGAIDVFY